MPEVRGKDVQVERFHQAVCYRPGCRWRGGLHATYEAANGDRRAHLDEHRGEPEPGHVGLLAPE
jgi:hypothetical protein